MFQFRPFPSYAYLIQRTMLKYCLSGFPHSEIHGYSGYLLLPVAYRSLSRPSSAPDAKAFPLRSFQLDLLSCKQERSRSGSHEFELCRLQSSLKLFVLPLKSSTKICCFPLLLALHTLVTLFSFQGAFLISVEIRFKHLASLNA